MYTGNIREVVSDNARGRSPRALPEGVISKPPRVFPGIPGYLGYNQFVG